MGKLFFELVDIDTSISDKAYWYAIANSNSVLKGFLRKRTENCPKESPVFFWHKMKSIPTRLNGQFDFIEYLNLRKTNRY